MFGGDLTCCARGHPDYVCDREALVKPMLGLFVEIYERHRNPRDGAAETLDGSLKVKLAPPKEMGGSGDGNLLLDWAWASAWTWAAFAGSSSSKQIFPPCALASPTFRTKIGATPFTSQCAGVVVFASTSGDDRETTATCTKHVDQPVLFIL